ncbi:hypothetical protein LXL04_018935 [Taraxacum kok-saghyz]
MKEMSRAGLRTSRVSKLAVGGIFSKTFYFLPLAVQKRKQNFEDKCEFPFLPLAVIHSNHYPYSLVLPREALHLILFIYPVTALRFIISCFHLIELSVYSTTTVIQISSFFKPLRLPANRLGTTMENHQNSQFDRPSQAFRGIQFVLIGFDPINKAQVSRKLVDGGGIDAGQYGPNCTHVIVNKLVYVKLLPQFAIFCIRLLESDFVYVNISVCCMMQDDPICVAARGDGKILVSGLWADHSFDVGVPVDPTSVMYRPVKDLYGIPGAKSLVICLTGYQREDREDIMTMVDLMGAQFSKPLIANKVTHLICYKFEGALTSFDFENEKVDYYFGTEVVVCMACSVMVGVGEVPSCKENEKDKAYQPQMVRRLVCFLFAYSLWLSVSRTFHLIVCLFHYIGSCQKFKFLTLIPFSFSSLKAWEIVSEADYSRSGYELEMETEAKDSEDEAGGVTIRLNEVKKESPLPSVMSKQDVSTSLPNTSASRGFESASDDMVSATMKNTSDQFLNPHKNVTGVTSEPSNLFEGTTSGSIAKKSSLSESRKVTSSIYSRKVAMETTPPTIDTVSNVNSGKKLDKVNLSDSFKFSSPLVEKEEQNGSSFGKRKMDISCGSSKLQKTSHSEDTLNRESPLVESAFQELKKDGIPPVSPAQNLYSNSTESKLLSSKGKSVTYYESISKIFTSKISPNKDVDAGLKETTKFDSINVGIVQQPVAHVEMQNLEKLSSPCVIDKATTPNMEKNEASGGSSSKPVRRKSIAKKFSAPKQNLGQNKTVNQKGSLHLENSEPKNNDTVGVENNLFKYQNEDQVSPVAKSAGAEIEKEMQVDNMSGNKSLAMDDETEPPEDKEEKHEDGGKPGPHTADAVILENAQNNEKDEDKSDDTEKNVVSKTSKEKKTPPVKKAKKKIALSLKDASDKKGTKSKEVSSDDNNQEPEIREEEATPIRASKRSKKMTNDLEKSKNNDTENVTMNKKKTSKCSVSKTKKDVALSVKDVNDKKNMEVSSNDNPEIREEEASTVRATKRSKKNENNLEKSMTAESKKDESTEEHVYSASETDEVHEVKSDDTENVVNKKPTKRSLNKLKKDDALSVKDPKLANKKGKSNSTKEVKSCDLDAQKENNQSAGNKQTIESKNKNKKVNLDCTSVEPMWFILTGHKLQRREFQQIIRRLKGKICRVSHQWSYQATHFIVPDPIKRTEKFFAAAASGSWILKTDYLSASNEAGRFLTEEPYEWHKNGLSEDGQINMEAPRKWRLIKKKTGHGAFFGMRVVIYGECIAPTLDTLKRAVKAGDGTILATSPPYTRFLNTNIDYAIVSPGMPRVDIWVQEFIKHEIPCVTADYLVEYVCKPGYPLERHVQFDTNVWAERSYNNLKNRLNEEESSETPRIDDLACEVCGSRDRGEEMLICGSESGLSGCGVGMHIDCCDPPFEDVPEEDWFCCKCSKPKNTSSNSKKSSKRKGK